ncbi:MAG TPA: GNAT family N-acetyltransferase [Actinocrinis sp.]
MSLIFEVDPVPDAALRAEYAELWADVANAGGSAGYVPPLTAEELRSATEEVLEAAAAGIDTLIIGRESIAGDAAGRGRLTATASLVAGRHQDVVAHWRTVRRVMVRPDRQGAGYGRLVMAEVERAARGLGLEALALRCRGQTGNDLFYKKCGYAEYGRMPKGLKLGPGDYREQILMMLPLD